MGQRLIVDIIKDGEIMAAVYFHWSAYTTTAFYELEKLKHIIFADEDITTSQFVGLDEENKPLYKNHTLKKEDLLKIDDLRLRLIKGLEAIGGGLDKGDIEYAKKEYPNETFLEDGYSRNEGLIAISEKEIQEHHGWSEGDALIDLDDMTVSNYCFFGVNMNDKDFKKWLKDMDFEEKDVVIKETDLSMECIPIDKLEEVAEKMTGLIEESTLVKTPHYYIEAIR